METASTSEIANIAAVALSPTGGDLLECHPRPEEKEFFARLESEKRVDRLKREAAEKDRLTVKLVPLETSMHTDRDQWDNHLNTGPPQLSKPLQAALANRAALSSKEKKKVVESYGSEAAKFKAPVHGGALHFSGERESKPAPHVPLTWEPPNAHVQRPPRPSTIQFRPARDEPIPFRYGPARKAGEQPKARGSYLPDGYTKDLAREASQPKKDKKKAGKLPDFQRDAEFRHVGGGARARDHSRASSGSSTSHGRDGGTPGEKGKATKVRRVNQATPRPPAAPAKPAKPAAQPTGTPGSGVRGRPLRSATSTRTSRTKGKKEAARLVDTWLDSQGGVCSGRYKKVANIPWDSRLDVRADHCHNCGIQKHRVEHCPYPPMGQERCSSCGRHGVTVARCPRCKSAHEREQQRDRERLMEEAEQQEEARLREMALKTRKGVPPPPPIPPTVTLEGTCADSSVVKQASSPLAAAPRALLVTSATQTDDLAVRHMECQTEINTSSVGTSTRKEAGLSEQPAVRPSHIETGEDGVRYKVYDDTGLRFPVERAGSRRSQQRKRQRAREAAKKAEQAGQQSAAADTEDPGDQQPEAGAGDGQQLEPVLMPVPPPVPSVPEAILEAVRALEALPEDQRHLVFDHVHCPGQSTSREANEQV